MIRYCNAHQVLPIFVYWTHPANKLGSFHYLFKGGFFSGKSLSGMILQFEKIDV